MPGSWLLAVGLWATAVGAAPVATAPSVAVLRMEARTGVPDSTARLLTETLVEELRSSGAFSRVASISEVEALLTLETQRQLAQCNTDSCAAEIAGALGVDLVVLASVGILGDSGVLTLRLIRNRSGVVLSSLSATVCASSESALLGVLRPGVRKLVVDASLAKDPPLPMPPEKCGAPPVAAATQPSPDPAQPAATASRRPLVLRVLGGAALGGSALALLAGALAVVTSAGWGLAVGQADFVAAVPTPGLVRTPRYVALVLPAAVAAGVGVLGLLVFLGAGLGAVGALAASFVG